MINTVSNPSSVRVRATLDAAYASGRVTGRSGKVFETFPTGLGREAGQALCEIVRRERAVRTIETGFAFGMSALFMLEAALSNNQRDAAHVAFDPFQAKNWDDAGIVLAEQAGVASIVRLWREDSTLGLPRLIGESDTYDFGFVDGGHHYEHVFLDTYFMTRLVRPGGLIVVDDVWMPAIRTAVDYFVTNLGLRIEPILEPGAKRFVALRLPDKPQKRAWDFFAPFAVAAARDAGGVA